MTAPNSSSTAKGFPAPQPSDLIRDGDDAITELGNKVALELDGRFIPDRVDTLADLNAAVDGPRIGYLSTASVQAAIGIAEAGTLIRHKTPNASVWHRVIITIGGSVWASTKVGGSGAWTTWRTAGPVTGSAGSAADLDTMSDPGIRTRYVSETAMHTAVGRLTRGLEITVRATGSVWQQLLIAPLAADMWTRERYGAGGSWSAWLQTGADLRSRLDALETQPAGGVPPSPVVARGGQIPTSVPVIAIRADHGLDKWHSIVHPLLVSLGLPSTLAIYTGILDGTATETTTLTDSALADAIASAGVEVASHSTSHGPGDLTTEIVTSKATLQARLGVRVLGWAQPGLTGAAGTAWESYAASSSDDDRYSTTVPGRMIAASYGWASGGGGTKAPLGQAYGIPVHAIDTTTDPVTLIDEIAADGRPTASVLMFHPGYIDGAGGLTTATLTAVLTRLAQLRNAGSIIVTTVGAIPALTTAPVTQPSITKATSVAAGSSIAPAMPSWAKGTPHLVTGTLAAPGTVTINSKPRDLPAGPIRWPITPTGNTIAIHTTTPITNLEITGI